MILVEGGLERHTAHRLRPPQLLSLVMSTDLVGGFRTLSALASLASSRISFVYTPTESLAFSYISSSQIPKLLSCIWMTRQSRLDRSGGAARLSPNNTAMIGIAAATRV